MVRQLEPDRRGMARWLAVAIAFGALASGGCLGIPSVRFHDPCEPCGLRIPGGRCRDCPAPCCESAACAEAAIVSPRQGLRGERFPTPVAFSAPTPRFHPVPTHPVFESSGQPDLAAPLLQAVPADERP